MWLLVLVNVALAKDTGISQVNADPGFSASVALLTDR